jgi:molybdate transport system substrate-binding protein
MRRCPVFLLLLFLALPPAFAQTLTVAVDHSLAEAVRALARGFEAGRAGVKVQVEAGASGVLLEKIAEGPKFDLLVSADLDTLARGTDRRLLAAGPPRVLAGNAIVVVAPAGSQGLQRLSDLARPEVLRIAMGRVASVPAGRQAREAIDAERLWSALQRKMVYADSVQAVLDMVARGEVDAGFVYRTDVPAGGSVRMAATPETPTPVRHAAALVAGSRQESLARDLLQALAAPAARAVWQQRGFTPP